MLHFRSCSPAVQLAVIMKRIYEHRQTTVSGGNISLIDENGDIWVTPSQIDKGNLQADDMVRIGRDGSISGKHRPTMEYRFHQGLYRARPDAGAVIHAHSPALVTLSISAEQPSFEYLPGISCSINPVGHAPYALPGSETLSEYVRKAFEGNVRVALLRNHGAVTIGKDLLEACHRFEVFETMASILIAARRIGGAAVKDRFPLTAFDLPATNHAIRRPSEAESRGRDELATFVKRAYQRGLVTAVSGCFSLRIREDQSFLFTPAGADWECLQPEDLVYIAEDHADQGKDCSTYTGIMLSIYDRHPEINAIACAHPPHLMAFAVSNAAFDTRAIPESYLLLGEIRKVSVNDWFSHADVNAILDNECVLMSGKSVFEVFDRLEVAEFTAMSLINATAFDGYKTISGDDLEDLSNTFAH